LIAGERRFRAAKLAGLREVPVQVRDVGDREALELAIVENVQREDLNPVEEARAYQRLAAEFTMTQDDIAARVGKTRAAISNSIRLLQLDPLILRRVEDGELSAGHARSLLALPAGEDVLKVAQDVVAKKLSVRDTERVVRDLSQRAADADRAALESRLSHALGTKVRIRTRGGSRGRVEIDFYSLDQFDGLVARLVPDGRAAASF
jgi:ParB family chromosome partitioning protein